MKKNMGTYDRVIRFIVAAVVIGLYQTNIVTGAVGIVLVSVALVLLLTSMIGTCPLYLPFGISTKKKKVDYKLLVKQGARIIDVRTSDEYSAGHLNGSLNIPLDHLLSSLFRIPEKDKPLILCCASGVRSAKAANILLSQGYTKAFNGGSWTTLQAQM